jgi:hypothetical protein
VQVHSVPVLADWSVDTLAAVLAEPLPCFYVLANTRALPAAEAAARAEEIGTNLRAAAARVGIDPARLGVVSRGDSTLRGHVPHETDALARGLGWAEPATLLAPFFFEGGRLTAHGPRRARPTAPPPPAATAATAIKPTACPLPPRRAQTARWGQGMHHVRAADIHTHTHTHMHTLYGHDMDMDMGVHACMCTPTCTHRHALRPRGRRLRRPHPRGGDRVRTGPRLRLQRL